MSTVELPASGPPPAGTAGPTAADAAARLARGRVHELDALRGLAIGLVMVRHSFPEVLGAGGIVGVEIFFVLSGYLITHLLLRQRAAGAYRPRAFYRNRAVRLLPALVVVVAINAGWDLAQGADPTLVVGGVLVALLFLSDLVNLLGLPIVANLNHLWTLAVEEQFYLVWPLVLARAGRRPSARFLRLAVLVGLGCTWASVAVLGLPEPTYSSPTTWILPLLVGAAVAGGAIRLPAGRGTAAPALVALLVLALLPHAKDHAVTYVVVVPVVALAAALVIVNAATPRSLELWRWRPLVALGTISYSAYLWNQPIAAHLPGWRALPVTVVVAALSYRFVERPFARFRA